MGKTKGRLKGRDPKPAAKAPTATPSSSESPLQKLTTVEAVALSAATQEDLDAAQHAAPPSPDLSAMELIARAVAAHALLESQRARVQEVEAEARRKSGQLTDRLQHLEEQRLTLQSQQSATLEQEADLRRREKALHDREAALTTRQADVVRRELDADAGFLERNRDALKALEAEGERLRERFSQHREQMSDERAAVADELQAKRDAFAVEVAVQRQRAIEDLADRSRDLQEEVSAERELLQKEREQLLKETQRLRREARDLAANRELLAEDRDLFDEKVARRCARDLEDRDSKIESLTQQLTSAREERDRLSNLLLAREEADRRFGGESPERVMTRLRTLEQERDQLRDKLGSRPSAEASQRLELLERQKEHWESDRLQLIGELSEARQDAARRRIAVSELEALRDETLSLQSANALLREGARQLRAEVDVLTKSAEGKPPFPSLSEMDDKPELQAAPARREAPLNLAEFAHEVRHGMASDPKTGKKLYYSAEDVRCFLGGLAMSRLHLLQGISGTGKTSLPLAFARAIGAGSALIEVQAGWRDRQDLVGHFNTFEGRFHETEFLKAVYRAGTPRFEDVPFIVVLDEMNLSHPEQYFADLLSALEQDTQRQRLVLMSAGVTPAPRRFVEDNTKLRIPPNLWFIGTANHDETTKDFADKTYDRAHVMELPERSVAFPVAPPKSQEPTSFAALEKSFQAAHGAHETTASKAYEYLQTELRATFAERFRIGWGNRLERQMRSYVPVVVSAGGTVGEATDHILASKLVRKLRDRHDNRPEDIIELRDQIRRSWTKLEKGAEPPVSLKVLRDELRRLGHDDD